MTRVRTGPTRACFTVAMRRLLLPALVPALTLALSVGLTGCGGDDEPGPSGSTSTAAAPEETDAAEPAPPPAAGSADDVIAEVTEVAPELESFYRGGPYPRSVEDAVASLDAAGVSLLPGHEVGGYTYDEDAVEFVLCLQDDDGAWASYDTAPMGVRDSGTSGGCPS